jgi:alkylation response protein AidB-like acyl-CoA dehydrogenase
MTTLSEVVSDAALRADRAGRSQPDAVEWLRHSGLPGLLVPKEYGGRGEDAVAGNRRIEALAADDPSLAIILFQHFAVATRIAEWGTEAQCREFLPRMATGEWLGASAWSEKGSGAN